MKAPCLLLSFFLITCFAGLAEAKDFPLLNDPVIPGAAGKVNVSKDRNGNLKVRVQVQHLARPSALTPSKNAYVVWIEGKDKQPQNVDAR